MNENNFSIEDARAFIAKSKWVFAKTMKATPHEYVNRKVISPTEQAEFDKFVRFIRENGEKCLYWNKEYTYLLIDGWYYWTMGAPIEETFILNRASTKTNRIVNGKMVVIRPHARE